MTHGVHEEGRSVFPAGDGVVGCRSAPRARALALVLEEIADTAPAARLELFELDRASHAAIAVWDAQGQGGTIVLEEKDGNFEVVIHLLTVT